MRVGIDLGTTYSVVAYINKETKKPEIIKNRYGNHQTPSVLAFVGNRILYGEEAAEYREDGNVSVVSHFKRYMGSEEYGYEGNGEVYTAKELSAILLSSLVEDASKEIGERVTEAVIAVPAYFTHKERKATIEAAKEAGIKVLHIINEPTAAIYAYAGGRYEKRGQYLVYDLGGGTFDVAVARVEQEKIRILSVGGNHELGGKEWNDLLARYLCELFYEEFGMDLSADRSEMLHIEAMAEKVKKRLSSAASTDCMITYLGRTGRYTITEEKLESMSSQLLDITKQITARALALAGLKKEDLDGVLLVGGATRMPMVHRAVEELFGPIVRNGISVDEAVAIGAAIKAYEEEEPADWLPDLDTREKERRTIKERIPGAKRVQETIAHSLGMISISEDGSMYVNSIIIKKNMPIPAKNTRDYKFSTSPGKNEMEIYLLQGEEGAPTDCELAGKYIVSGISDSIEGDTVIQVTYCYNEEGMIEVYATQNGTPLTVEAKEGAVDLSFLKEPPKIPKEHRVSEVEGTIYLAVDLSGSMAGIPLLQAKKAIEEFILKLDLSRMAVGIIGFADKTELLLSPTHDFYRIEQALINMRVDGNRFGYGNAASPFASIYEEYNDEEENKYIILITDGAWAYKENAVNEARRCKQKEIEILALGFGSADEAFLDQIVSKEEYAQMTELSCLTQSFTKIAQIMGS